MSKSAPNFSLLSEKWSSAFVARSEIERFTGGIVTAKYLANLDCQGKGPCERIKVGRKVCYPVWAVVEWLESRVVNID